MNQILNKVRGLDPHNLDAAKEALSSFFSNLTKHKDGDCIHWLRTLENVINRFPKLCGSQRATIEKYLCHFLEASNYNTVVEAAKCAHALQQVRPGQEKSSTPKVCWRDLMCALCNAVHSLISKIFPNAANIYRHNEDQESEPSNSLLLSAFKSINVVSGENNILNRETLLCTRLRNTFIFIQAMLVEIYPVAKPVRPQLVLDVVIRALGASAGAAPQHVATVKQQALRTLDALVACLGPNLIPYSPLVLKCVMQTLRWATDNASEESNKVRVSAYSSLRLWLTALRSHRAPPSRGRDWQDELTQHVARDVTPAAHTVQLTLNNQTRNLSKKQKKKQARVSLQQSSIASYSPQETNKPPISTESSDQIAIAALECTEIFLTVCGMFLKPATHKAFHELLVRESFQLDNYSNNRGYALLQALEASRKTAPPGVPPPTQYCLQLYSALLTSPHPEITKFCSQALLDIRLHLHCSPATLNFAAEVQSEREVEDKRKVSRRNREALESLLGADKIPTKINEVEIIPIIEEPANKKPRLEEEISDKISLHSSSGNSVEICYTDSDNEVEEVSITHEISAEIHNSSNETEEINEKSNIHDAVTQMPQLVSNDTIDGTASPESMEVVYGNPNTGTERVTVLEKLDDENLPSTNDTDDVQITCGQMIKSLDDDPKLDNDVNEQVKLNESQSCEPKVNGIKSPEKVEADVVEGSVTVKIAANNEGVSVEDMLADFVDEVNDDNLTKA
ncbi:proline-, glutamic acid- and leucine-rich protein 1-like [Choristoneura fumiferana]|uniref:proline-, glutamic acid- and leucine-rich protein 1-like n=1 Tax=Choristoneura fumiferana TaxID=7141 RepID=UPI003D15EEEB